METKTIAIVSAMESEIYYVDEFLKNRQKKFALLHGFWE